MPTTQILRNTEQLKNFEQINLDYDIKQTIMTNKFSVVGCKRLYSKNIVKVHSLLHNELISPINNIQGQFFDN